MADKKVWILLCLFLFLPYLLLRIFSLVPNRKTEENSLTDTVYYVARQESYGIRFVPMEEYLAYLIANTGEEYEEETIKAMIVLWRSSILFFCDEVGKGEVTGNRYLFTREEELGMKPEFTSEYTEKEKELVLSTKGIYLSYGEKPVMGSFYECSAGRTREAEDEYPYLTSVSCGQDLYHEKFVSSFTYTVQELCRMLGCDAMDLHIVSKDSTDYVTLLRNGDHYYTGEEFRELLHLPSAYFSINTYADSIRIITNGIGHGFGMSLFTADQMAAEGDSFEEILMFFYQNITLSKIE